MSNESLIEAMRRKNDEYYTKYADVENEINEYLSYNPDVFRGKVVLLPCDDPEWSNFTKFFINNFSRFGLRKLISTCYIAGGSGKILEYAGGVYTGGWQYLDGDGDFGSDEVCRFRDECDIIVTNPPFSLFRKFLKWIMDGGKKFIIIGNQNAITYKEVFPLIRDDVIWLGVRNGSKEYVCMDGSIKKLGNTCWFTNVEHGRRKQPMELMTMDENIRNSRHKEVRGVGYKHYDNYDAIEVPYTDAIPMDYVGIMGVPISFLDKYNPKQFEIVGEANHGSDSEYDIFKPSVDGKCVFKRILIRNRQNK